MKPLLLLLSVFALLSCEKPIMTEDPAVSGFPADNGNLTVTIPQTPEAQRLNFAVYNMAGTRIKQVNQTSAAADFGKASFQLDAANYQLVVLTHSSNGNPTMTDPHKIRFSNSQGYTDTFLYYGQVTVIADHQNLSVVPRRIVALCRFVITDDYPAEAASMHFYYTGGSGTFDAATGLGNVNSKQESKFDITNGQKQFDLYTFLHDTEGTILLTATALDASGVEILQRDFEVPLKQNYITTLTGAFFAPPDTDTDGIAIRFNTDWDGEYHLTF